VWSRSRGTAVRGSLDARGNRERDDARLLESFHATIALDASDGPRLCVIGSGQALEKILAAFRSKLMGASGGDLHASILGGVAKPPRSRQKTRPPKAGTGVQRDESNRRERVEPQPSANSTSRKTIPVQAEWLESETNPETSRGAPDRAPAVIRVPRPSPRPRRGKGPPPLPPLIPAYSADAQDALKRLQTLHRIGDETLFDVLRRKLKNALDHGLVKMIVREGDVVLELDMGPLFASRALSAAEAKAIAEIAHAMSDIVGAQLQVEGLGSAQNEGEWALCGAHVAEVAKQLVANGIRPSTISVAAFGKLGTETGARRAIAIRVSAEKGAAS
jgi:hypothetical protein